METRESHFAGVIPSSSARSAAMHPPLGAAAAAASTPVASVNNIISSPDDAGGSSTRMASSSRSLVPEASLYPVGHDSYTAADLYQEHRHGNNNNNNSNNSNLTFNGKQRPTQFLAKWPTELTRLMSINMDDEWRDVMDRIISHPVEITVQGMNGGLNALHAACLRYPPTHVVQALLQARPAAATAQNFNGETPLHVASYGSSASEEVQLVLLQTAPEVAAVAEQNGDTALHFAVRSGATLHFMERLLQAAPQCISHRNNRGMHPFWLLPRRFLEANDMEEILNAEHAEPEYRDDWDALVLFLKYSYQYNCSINSRKRREIFIDRQEDSREHYHWVVHAAAATPACPREVLAFLCRMYPEQALVYNDDGCTPLLLAVQATPEEMLLDEPTEDAWDVNEDGFREHVDAATGELHNREDAVAEEEVALSEGDADFITRAIQGRRVATSSESNDNSNASSPEAASDENDDDDDAQVESEHHRDKPTAVDILLEWSPRSACIADEHSQRLPLAHALLSGQSWKTIRSLIAVFPRAINTRDPPTSGGGNDNGGGSSGLHMFQLAAMASPDLDSIYLIVRSLPQLVGTTGRRRSCSSRQSPAKEDVDEQKNETSPPRKKPKLS
jgi:Ankyrin repeats (many copies)